MTKSNAVENEDGPGASRTEDSGRVVDGLGALLAVSPSLGPALKGWTRLGFTPSEPYEYFGCRAFDIPLRGCGVRVVAPTADSARTAFARIVHEHLAGVPGLLGWTWTCRDSAVSKRRIEERCGREFDTEITSRGILLPPDLTPGATTLLETATEPDPAPRHENRIDRIDHVVLMVNDSDAVVGAYAAAFALKPKSRSMKDARYNFMKVGSRDASVVEVVGPESPKRGPLGGRAWGVTFAAPDFDGCLRAMAARGVRFRDPHAAIQGGRITSLTVPFGGIQIAVLGD